MPRSMLSRASQHCFMAGVGDVSMALCEANVPYGLAKIHFTQDLLGIPPDATFVGSPDATITRNNKRWSQGFGYGGVYEWSGDFTVLDIKPNACGMSVGALHSLPDRDALRERLHDLDRDGLELDGIPLHNDLAESNHFVDVFEVKPAITPTHAGSDAADTDPDTIERARPASAAGRLLGDTRYVYIMHSSGHEHRGASRRGPGLYWDESDELRAMARRIDTPWGSLHILEGEGAAAWYRFYREVQDFNHRRREALGRFLFGDHEVLINATHQGMVRGYNSANIGCYTFDDPGDPGTPAGSRADLARTIFPLTLSPTLPAFLVKGKQNFSQAAIERLGWNLPIERFGLAERIARTNLLPHGGGYTYPAFRGVAEVFEHGPDDRRFELWPVDPAAPFKLIETPRELPYTYRGMEVKSRLEELDLGDIVAELDLLYVLGA